MEIRDVIHGFIILDRHELPIVNSREFQRLRHIKQTGFAEHSYPGMTHNRFGHSLGALQTGTLLFESIFGGKRRLPPDAYRRFRAITRIAALLHDIGHGPLSHTTEFAMPPVSELNIPLPKRNTQRKATHEDYTLKIILDSPLTPILEKAGKSFGFKPIHIASLIEPEIVPPDSFFEDRWDQRRIGFRPLLQQLVSSELDADRMDYLRRDSYYAGVSYGYFAHEWITGNLTAHIQGNECFLALRHRALYAFEDFLLSRYHMFLMVYLHHKTVIYDEMLAKYFQHADCDYRLPAKMEEYIDCTDAQLTSHLTKSKNEWAKRIVNKDPYRMILETHSGIPDNDRAREQQDRLFRRITQELGQKSIPFLTAQSTGILSKYFGRSHTPIFVLYDNLYSAQTYIPIQKCTTLFTKYPSKRSISRIYVSDNDYSRLKQKGRDRALDLNER